MTEQKELSPNVVLSWFCKNGHLWRYSAKLHALEPDARRAVVADICNGFDPVFTIENAAADLPKKKRKLNK